MANIDNLSEPNSADNISNNSKPATANKACIDTVTQSMHDGSSNLSTKQFVSSEFIDNYVEVAYSPNGKQTIIKKIAYQPNLNVNDVICRSGLLDNYPEIANYTVGIFKNVVTKYTLVTPKDRVEIYRPLLVCPKEKRRKRAK